MGATDLPQRAKGSTLVFTIGDDVEYIGTDPVVPIAASGIVVSAGFDMVRATFDGTDYYVKPEHLRRVEPAWSAEDELPVPYAPVEPITTVPGFVRHNNEPCDLRPRFSSQDGAAAHLYSPTRFGALNPSGGAVPKPNPAPSDDAQLLRRDAVSVEGRPQADDLSLQSADGSGAGLRELDLNVDELEHPGVGVDSLRVGVSECNNGFLDLVHEPLGDGRNFAAHVNSSAVVPEDPSSGEVASIVGVATDTAGASSHAGRASAVSPSSPGTPSLVGLDRQEAAERALAALVEWREADDVGAHIHATIALRKAADEYREVAR